MSSSNNTLKEKNTELKFAVLIMTIAIIKMMLKIDDVMSLVHLSAYILISFALREKCPNTEFFLVRIQENTGQKKYRIWTLFTQCWRS